MRVVSTVWDVVGRLLKEEVACLFWRSSLDVCTVQVVQYLHGHTANSMKGGVGGREKPLDFFFYFYSTQHTHTHTYEFKLCA